MEPQELSLRIASASPNHCTSSGVEFKIGWIELRRKRSTMYCVPLHVREMEFIRSGTSPMDHSERGVCG